MDMGTILHAMRDPAGIPSNPLIFQILMVATWIFHIAFVNLALGSAALSLYAFTRRQEDNWQRLTIAMTKVAKVSVSLLVVLGVAPLLFTQVIYDPQWYASNVLSAAWAIAFIFTLIVGYSSWFVFYFKNHEGASGGILLWGLLGLGLFLLDGFIMHVLSYQALLPNQWMQWYMPNGHVDMSGTHIHAWQAPRFVFFLAMSATVFGAFLTAYADYFNQRPDRPAAYREFVSALGTKIALIGVILQFVLLLWWLADVPSELGMWRHPISLSLIAYLAILMPYFWLKGRAGTGTGYKTFAMTTGMIALVAIFREALRMAYMKPFHYNVLDYKVVTDYPSLALFFLTFIGVGGLLGGFYLVTVYRAGRIQGEYQAEASVARLGTGAVGIMIVWIATFFLTGIWVWVRNLL